eukprot:TRINITY_DN81866_c0_g1_i1.p1 TRINITY_DN81866_c0_g1~~TRINITY_DN81866_c0_g1_i1.p1  ORF type:complete len:110 (-),score=8.95 TRINITY_DN81866_c0_g1_i1:206-535(-)
MTNGNPYNHRSFLYRKVADIKQEVECILQEYDDEIITVSDAEMLLLDFEEEIRTIALKKQEFGEFLDFIEEFRIHVHSSSFYGKNSVMYSLAYGIAYLETVLWNCDHFM